MLEKHEGGPIVLLTTQERVAMFESTLGPGVDARLCPGETNPLQECLFKCAKDGARLAVLDEYHFVCVKDLLKGVQDYLDDPLFKVYPLEFIVVCQQRRPGDAALRHLAAHCGLYSLVCNCGDEEACIQVASLLQSPNTRSDIVHLLYPKNARGQDSCCALHLADETKRHSSDGITENGLRKETLWRVAGKTTSRFKSTSNDAARDEPAQSDRSFSLHIRIEIRTDPLPQQVK